MLKFKLRTKSGVAAARLLGGLYWAVPWPSGRVQQGAQLKEASASRD